MPERDDRLQPEHYTGAAAGALPLLTMATQGRSPDLTASQKLTAKQLSRRVLSGDILLTRSKHPASGFRVFTSAITGEPVYHAELLTRNRRGQPVASLAGASQRLLSESLGPENDLAVLVRPKHLKNVKPSAKRRLLREAVKLTKQTYSDVKVPLIGLAQTAIPQSKLLGKLPVICKGDVCSTGPAAVMRQAGIDPKLRAVPGMELAGDYLRNPNYKVVGRWQSPGARMPKYFRLTHGLPGRLALGGAAGLGTYQAVKDTREGRPLAPLAGLVGAGIGGLAGMKFEELAANAYADPRGVKTQLKNQLKPILSKRMSARTARRLTPVLKTLHTKYTLIPALLMTLLGGGAAYYGAREAYD